MSYSGTVTTQIKVKYSGMLILNTERSKVTSSWRRSRERSDSEDDDMEEKQDIYMR